MVAPLVECKIEIIKNKGWKMIFIKKAPAPLELEKLKRKAEEQKLSDTEAYNLLRNPLKARVREALMHKQGHLCAYCMRRIPDERIEESDLY